MNKERYCGNCGHLEYYHELKKLGSSHTYVCIEDCDCIHFYPDNEEEQI